MSRQLINADCVRSMTDEEAEIALKEEEKDYIDCIYNWWSGFVGKETCDAGYLVCNGECCPMYHKAEEDA